MIKISLPDGSFKEVKKGTTSLEIAKGISEGLARKVLAAEINGEVCDLTMPLNNNCSLKLLTFQNNGGKSTMWHSSAHLMAEAIEFFYPGVKLAIGPPVENGFYYDIDFEDYEISEKDLLKIEKKIIELAREKNKFEKKSISKNDAINYFKKKNDPYKLELLEDLEDGSITFYTQGKFTDLCRGPHLPHTGFIKAVKLLNIAGAYWRGDESNKQLTRIYGISFEKQKDLNLYLEQIEEAKKRDHRKLGKELELFTFSEKVGLGLPLWLPKGTELKERLMDFLKKAQISAGYLPVSTPHIGHKDLYVCSGHYDKYGADSFQPISTPHENEEFLLKPMNCPHHCEIFNASPKSYRDLPLRLAEFGTVYRYEQSGELHGLTRVRGFTQDDAHIFCRTDQLEFEFKKVIDLVLYVFKALNFSDFVVQVSLRDKKNKNKYIGSEENWDKAEKAIINAANEKGLQTTIEYGEAAFYGPKLDFMVKDALNRSWQLGTIQVDYNLPERFDLLYTGSDNKKHRPVMIHRAPFGSLERFIALLIEHTAGKFPLWLNPEQFIILPLSELYNEYAQEVLKILKNYDIRGLVDQRAEKIGRKIRDAELNKIPFMLIVGEKEANEKLVSVRQQGKGDLGTFKILDFKNLINENISESLVNFEELS